MLLKANCWASGRSRTKCALLFIVLSVVGILCACPPVATVQPLYTWNEKEKVDDPGLEGTWISFEWQDDEHGFNPISLSIKRDKDSHTALSEFELDAAMSGAATCYSAVLLRLGGHEFLDVTPKNDSIYQHEFLQHAIVTHTIYRLRRDGDDLRLAFLDGEWASGNLPKEHLIDTGDKYVTIATLTNSTEELQTIFETHADDPKAFKTEFHFKRQESVAAAESLSAVALDGLSHAYMVAGQYEKALSATQRFIELRPKNPSGHYQAARAFLANYDSAEAHLEFRKWFGLCSSSNRDRDWELNLANDDADQCSPENEFDKYLGWTDFVAANYADAAKEFDRYLESLDDGSLFQSSDVVFWNIVALKSLQRSEEVQRVYERYRSHNGMSAWADALAKYLHGDLTEFDLLKIAESSVGNKREAYFYVGSICLISGDKQAAKQMFQKILEMGDYESDEAIAARLRIRQLDAK